jgi:hypothetical protein
MEEIQKVLNGMHRSSDRTTRVAPGAQVLSQINCILSIGRFTHLAVSLRLRPQVPFMNDDFAYLILASCGADRNGDCEFCRLPALIPLVSSFSCQQTTAVPRGG